MFQQKLEQILTNCEIRFINDIVLTGGSEAEHDLAVEEVHILRLTEIQFSGTSIKME